MAYKACLHIYFVQVHMRIRASTYAHAHVHTCVRMQVFLRVLGVRSMEQSGRGLLLEEQGSLL